MHHFWAGRRGARAGWPVRCALVGVDRGGRWRGAATEAGGSSEEWYCLCARATTMIARSALALQ